MSDEPIKYMLVKDIILDEGARELMNSPNMRPYIELAKAGLSHSDPAEELAVVRQLPLEERYLWRIASSLQRAFADFDSRSVRVDIETLTPEDLATF